MINYDIPDTTDAYTHRIGRTGRAAKTGDAFTFVSREDEPLVRSIERVLGQKIERRLLKDFDYKRSAPARDAEFSRPPREHQHRRPQQKPAGVSSHGAAHGRPQAHHGKPQGGDAPRGPATGVPRPSGTRSFKPRSRRSGPGR